jgi:esterase
VDTFDTPSDLTERLLAFRSSHEFQSVSRNGLDWYFLKGGFGVPVVLMPGLCGNSDELFALMTVLETEFQVVAISWPEELTHLPDLTQAVLAIMDSLSIQSAYIFGHSIGGLLAECFMKEYPDRAAGLILANVSHLAPMRETVVRSALTVLPFTPRKFLEQKAFRAIRMQLAGSKDEPFWAPYLEAEFRGMSSKVLSNRATCVLNALDRYPENRIDLDGWNRRVLVIESDNDPACTSAEREDLRRLYSRAEVQLLPGTGHFSIYTRPDVFAQAVLTFLRDFN